jgi:uncharacterized membrane protein (UPF0136 family)
MVAYTVLMIGLGVFGFIKTQSAVSLIAGSIAGLAVLGCMGWSLKNPRPAYITALVFGVLIGGESLSRFLKSFEFFPRGVIVLVNVFLILALLIGHLIAMQAKKKEAGEANQ